MLPKSQRLRSRRDFRLVYGRGRSYVHPLMVLYARPTKSDSCRVGFSISKKLGGAVQRNRIKRRLREAIRSHSAKLRPGMDVVVVGRSRLKEASYEAMQQAIEELLRRAKLTIDPPAPEAPPCGDLQK